MKKEDLKAGYVIETDRDLRVLMPIMYQGKETLAMVKNLAYGTCQQILTYDPFERLKVVRVWGLPTDARGWLEISTKNRPLLWEREEKKKVTLEVTNEQLKKIEEMLKC